MRTLQRQQKSFSDDRYDQTIAVYQRLGRSYLASIDRVVPADRAPFAQRLRPGARILDVACAGGRDAAYFVRRGFTVFGIDAVDAFVRAARRRVPKGRFRTMDIRHLRFPPESFDAIWAHAILLHIRRSDVPAVLHSFHRILKRDGLLHVCTKWGRGTKHIQEKLTEGQERTTTLFHKNELERQFRKAGFTILLSQRRSDDFGRKNVRRVTVWAKKSFSSSRAHSPTHPIR